MLASHNRGVSSEDHKLRSVNDWLRVAWLGVYGGDGTGGNPSGHQYEGVLAAIDEARQSCMIYIHEMPEFYESNLRLTRIKISEALNNAIANLRDPYLVDRTISLLTFATQELKELEPTVRRSPRSVKSSNEEKEDIDSDRFVDACFEVGLDPNQTSIFDLVCKRHGLDSGKTSRIELAAKIMGIDPDLVTLEKLDNHFGMDWVNEITKL